MRVAPRRVWVPVGEFTDWLSLFARWFPFPWRGLRCARGKHDWVFTMSHLGDPIIRECLHCFRFEVSEFTAEPPGVA